MIYKTSAAHIHHFASTETGQEDMFQLTLFLNVRKQISNRTRKTKFQRKSKPEEFFHAIASQVLWPLLFSNFGRVRQADGMSSGFKTNLGQSDPASTKYKISQVCVVVVHTCSLLWRLRDQSSPGQA